MGNWLAALAAYIPATGEHVDYTPYIIAGIAVLVLVAVAVVTATGKKKK